MAINNPQVGDEVFISGEIGLYVVKNVDTQAQTATVALKYNDLREWDVSWTLLVPTPVGP